MNITDILHKTFGKETETIVEDIAAAVIPQAEAAAENAVRNLLPTLQKSLTDAIIPALVTGLKTSVGELVDGRRLVVTVEVVAK